MSIILYLILFSLSFSQEIIAGYLHEIEISSCMDECGKYYVEPEFDGFPGGAGYWPVIFDDTFDDIYMYLNRYVNIELGEEINCDECFAYEVEEINLSNNCFVPVTCFVDPCEIAEDCQLNTPIECIPNYCGGCYADTYDLDGNLVDCYNNYIPIACDDLNAIDFGMCDMFLGYAIINNSCVGLSGCGWDLNGIDYYDAFFNTLEDCELNCSDSTNTCEEIEYSYEELHNNTNASCMVDNDCISIWGHCDIGLGGCHYSVNEDLFSEYEMNSLVEQWNAADCMGGVCDCMDLPYAQCIGGVCTSSYCQTNNPAGCFQTGCVDNYSCINTPSTCTPSSCFCSNDFYGYWYCTEDCGGGECVLLGDCNSDNFINVIDVVLVVNTILNGEYNILADVNEDNFLDVSDVVVLINIILNSLLNG